MKGPIEQAREELGLTIQELAIMADVSDTTVYRNLKAEARTVSPKILEALGKAGYDPGRLKRGYEEYRKEKQRELIESSE